MVSSWHLRDGGSLSVDKKRAKIRVHKEQHVGVSGKGSRKVDLTPEKLEDFKEELRAGYHPQIAIGRIGVGEYLASRWRKEEPAFKEAWDSYYTQKRLAKGGEVR